MKKTITIILITLSLLLILDSIDFSHALMMFILAGVIPGTNITIDASQMLWLFAMIGGFIVGRAMAFVVRSLKTTRPAPVTHHSARA
ncbi:MAG: hypothetical protein WAQ27_02095 [Candidatus Microsaccharimonas sp.]